MHSNEEPSINEEIKGWDNDEQPTTYTSNYLKHFNPNFHRSFLRKNESNMRKLPIAQSLKMPYKNGSTDPGPQKRSQLYQKQQPWMIGTDKANLLRYLCPSQKLKIKHQVKLSNIQESGNHTKHEQQLKIINRSQLIQKDLPSLGKENRKPDRLFNELFLEPKREKKARRKYITKSKIYEQIPIQTEFAKQRQRQVSKKQFKNNFQTNRVQPQKQHKQRVATELQINKIKKFPLFFRQITLLEHKKQYHKKPQNIQYPINQKLRQTICRSQFCPTPLPSVPPTPPEAALQFTDDNIFSTQIIRV